METITHYASKLLFIPTIAFIVWLVIYVGFPKWIKSLKGQTPKQLIILLIKRKHISWVFPLLIILGYSTLVNLSSLLPNLLLTSLAIIFYFLFKKKITHLL